MHDFIYRIDDILISGTAAEVSGHFFADLISGEFFALLQKDSRRHDKSRCTETALNCTFFDKCFLDPCDLPVFFQTFEGADVFALRPDSKIDAGIYRFSVYDDGTGTTFAYFTAFLTEVRPR